MPVEQVPAWLSKVQDAETRLIMRSSAAYALKGRVADLGMDAAKARNPVRPSDEPGWFQMPKKRRMRVTYASGYSGRPLATELPQMADTIPLEALHLSKAARSALAARKRAEQDADVAGKDLDDVVADKSNPLSSVRDVVLRNANAAARGEGLERGVKAVEETFPDSMKPSAVMQRFKLFKWAGDGAAAATKSLKRDKGGGGPAQPGVSAGNKRGHTGEAVYTAHRGGSGMVKGRLCVTYADAYVATAEAMKWGSLGRVEYSEGGVDMVVALAPTAYEGFELALAELCAEPYTFSSQLSPPLFVADIGGRRSRKKGSGGGGETALGMAAAAQVAAEEAGGRRGTPPWEGKDESTVPTAAAKPARRRAEVSEEALAKEALRMAVVEAQVEIDARFRTLAGAGKSASVMGLLKRGWQVHVDKSPTYLQRDAKHMAKRAYHMEKQREEEAAKGRAINMWLGAGEEATRVHPRIDSVDEGGNTALLLAAKAGWPEVVTELLAAGASRRRKNGSGLTPLAAAKAESSAASLAVFTGAAGAASRKRRAAACVLALDDRSLLATVAAGDLRRARYLLAECGQPVNSTNKYGMTPLHFAALHGDVEMVQLLASFGANGRAVNNAGQTPKSIAGGTPDEGVREALLEALQAGPGIAKARARAVAVRAEQEAAAAKERDLLARELRIATKGTAAAAAVFRSFKKRGGKGRGAYAADTTRALAGPLPDPAAVTEAPGRYAIGAAGRAAMDWGPTAHRNGLSVEASWNRHALALFGAQMKAKAAGEYTAKVRAGKAEAALAATQATLASGEATQAALRGTSDRGYWLEDRGREAAILSGAVDRNRGVPGSTIAKGGVGAVGGAAAEFAAKAASPAALDAGMRAQHVVASPRDGNFDAWLRLRFGAVDAVGQLP